MIQITLYFGRQERNGRFITEDEFMQFLGSQVTPIFGSYTILPAVGMWKGLKEPCTVVVINTDQKSEEVIEKISLKYNELFFNDCVMATYQEIETHLYGTK